MKIRNLKQKKAQEEMVGFMLIIILVTVIAFIFLILSIRRPAERQEDVKIESFIYSLLRFDVNCGDNVDYKQLIIKCQGGEICLDKGACKLLNETSYSVVDSEWGADRYNAYFFKIHMQNDSLVELNKGNCTGTKKGASVVVPVFGENMYIDLEVCY